MSPSKLSFHDGHILNHQAPILNLSSYTSSLTSSSSPASGMSHDSDGRSSSSSPNNLNSSIFSGFGHACSHCTSSFLTRDLLEKHEMMHISNATMVSSHFFVLLIFNSLFSWIYTQKKSGTAKMLLLIKFLHNSNQQTHRKGKIQLKLFCLLSSLHFPSLRSNLNSLNIHEKLCLIFIAKSAEK